MGPCKNTVKIWVWVHKSYKINAVYPSPTSALAGLAPQLIKAGVGVPAPSSLAHGRRAGCLAGGKQWAGEARRPHDYMWGLCRLLAGWP